MGCFPYTCSVSSFPIAAGHPVRFLALAQSPDNEGRFVCDVEGVWQPIALPIKGVYNDYGSVAEIEVGPVADAFFEVLNTRALERSVGDNRIHDVAVAHGMSQDQWLRALWEGRVQITDRHDATQLQVVQAMVREDVWQILVGECMHTDGALRRAHQHPLAIGPFRNLWFQRPLSGLMLSATVELLRVQSSLSALGRHWTRGTTIGRDEHEIWLGHERFLKSLLEIASRHTDADRDSE